MVFGQDFLSGEQLLSQSERSLQAAFHIGAKSRLVAC